VPSSVQYSTGHYVAVSQCSDQCNEDKEEMSAANEEWFGYEVMNEERTDLKGRSVMHSEKVNAPYIDNCHHIV
jgi:hypothetical protein